MDCSPPGSSVHGISQARILEWAAKCLASSKCWTSISPSLSFPLGGLNVALEGGCSFLGAQPSALGGSPCWFPLPTPAPSGSGGQDGWQELPAARWPPGKLRICPQSWLSAGPFPPGWPGKQSRRPRPQVSPSSSALPLPPGLAWPAPSEALRQPHCLCQALTRLAGLPGSRGLSKHLHGFS